jgi:DNA end-binding protein Ku
MRPIWTGSINFGLVNIPVKLYSAVQSSSLDLDMLDSKDHSNIRFKRVNENTGKEVPYKDIVKGYKVEDDYVVLEDKDFEAADAEKTGTIDILNFVNESEIDSIYYEQPYFLEPAKGAMKAYALLRDSLQASAKVGVSLFVLRKKESLAILKPYNKVVVLNRIRFMQEIRETEDLNLPEFTKSKTKELEMADKLIDQLTEEFDISAYKDTYTDKLLKIIEDKSKGKRPKTVKMKQGVSRKKDDLMSMLKASLEEKKKNKVS